MRKQVFISTLSAVLALLVVTCAPPGMDSIRDAMVAPSEDSSILGDAAELIGDAADGMTPDATAGAMTYAGTCVPAMSSVDYTDGRYERRTYWHAEIRVPGLDAATVESITAVTCDYERFGPPMDWPACPMGATCTHDPVPYPLGYRADCRVSGFAEIVGDVVRVGCGSRTEFQLSPPPATPMPYDVGERARSARIVVR